MAEPADELPPQRLPIPEISAELIRWLRATNPIRPLLRSQDLRDADRAAGLQELIDKLNMLHLLQVSVEEGGLSEEERKDAMEMLVWEAPTKEQQEMGFVLRAT